MVKEINSDDFKEKISKGKSLVDAFAFWCKPCLMLSPIIEELSSEMKDIKFYKLDVDKSPDVAESYGVMGIPTLILFKDGKESKRIIGLRRKVEILSDFGLHCVSCFGSQFENLEQGCKGHGMSDEEINELIEKLNKVVDS